MACADTDMDISWEDERLHSSNRRDLPVIQRYQATELVPDSKGSLHDLLQTQPAVVGTLQVLCGLLSVGVGVLFAVTQEMAQSLFTLFRVSHLTGALFIIAGVVSNLLFRFPGLLPVSLGVNCGCIIVAVVAVCLIGVDLSQWRPENEEFLKMELLVLCVLGLEASLSGILCFWFSSKKRTKSP